MTGPAPTGVEIEAFLEGKAREGLTRNAEQGIPARYAHIGLHLFHALADAVLYPGGGRVVAALRADPAVVFLAATAVEERLWDEMKAQR